MSSLAQRLTSRLHGIPPLLLAMYFVNAWIVAFPDTAYGVWLNAGIKMAQNTQSDFYAFTFLPTMMKPVFGYISDRYPIAGSHRRAYIVICSLGASAMFFVQGTLVRSVPLAFAVAFVRAGFTSFVELMLGALLVEIVHKDVAKAGAIQSVVITVRSAGALTALLSGLSVYTCESMLTVPRAKAIITGMMAMPLLNAAMAMQLDQDRAPKLEDGERPLRRPKASHHEGQLVLMMILVQIVLVWIGLKSFIGQTWFVNYAHWWQLLTVMIAAVCLIALVLGHRLSSHPHAHSCASLHARSQYIWHGCTALFLFLYNAAPGASVQLYNYELSLFGTRICYMQFLAIAGSASRCVAGVLFGWAHSVLRARTVLGGGGAMAQDNTVPLMLVVAAAVSSIAGLVFLPLLPSVGSLSLYSHMDRAFAYDMVMTCITGVASYMAFIPAVVLATERAAIEHRPHRRQRWRQRQRRIRQRRQDAKWAAGGGVEGAGEEEGLCVDLGQELLGGYDREDTGEYVEGGGDTDSEEDGEGAAGNGSSTALLYGMYLSFIDFGDSAGGWISADIVARLGITGAMSMGAGGWDSLWKLVVIGTAAKLGTLLFVPLLVLKRPALSPPASPSSLLGGKA